MLMLKPLIFSFDEVEATTSEGSRRCPWVPLRSRGASLVACTR